MTQQDENQSYETPTLVEIGVFAELTSGNGSDNEDLTSRYSWW
jgi:hypothetical protein